MSSTSSWLDYTDAEYKAMRDKWAYTWRVFTGEYADREHVKAFLIKRAHWEKTDAYENRIGAADPDLLFSVLMGSIVGQLFATEKDASYTWQHEGAEGLGDPNDPSTVMGRLWDNIDGGGTNFPVMLRSFALRELVFQSMYVLVEGVEAVSVVDDEGNETGEEVVGDARITLITPDMVLAKGYDGQRLSWVKVRHVVTVGDEDPMGEQKEEEQYTVYRIDGWTRYRKVDAGGAVGEEVIAEGDYEYYDAADRVRRVLPIFRVSFPFPTYIAHYLARKGVVIFNLESVRDTYLGEATATHLIEEGDPMAYEAHRDDMAAGETHHNFSPSQKAYYIAPPDGPARLATDVLADKRKTLFESAYQQYGDAAAQTTATEIRQDARAGIEAFLSLFASTVEEMINRSLFLLEQVYFPDRPEVWGGARVELSREFVPSDPNAEDMALRDIFFGPNAIPTDSATLAAVIRRMIERKGFPVTDEQKIELEGIASAIVAQRDGLRPRLASAAGDIDTMLAAFNGAAPTA